MSDNEIIEEIQRQTNETITRSGLYKIKQQIKKESYDWYKNMREGQHEYIHEFKERIEEILWLQMKHHELIESNKHNPVYLRNIKKKIRFVKWILKAIKSDSFTH